MEKEIIDLLTGIGTISLLIFGFCFIKIQIYVMKVDGKYKDPLFFHFVAIIRYIELTKQQGKVGRLVYYLSGSFLCFMTSIILTIIVVAT